VSRKELAALELVVKQGWCAADSPFAQWLLVDRRQVLGVLRLIANRLKVHPKRLPPER
jgi:hypothetical protein